MDDDTQLLMPILTALWQHQQLPTHIYRVLISSPACDYPIPLTVDALCYALRNPHESRLGCVPGIGMRSLRHLYHIFLEQRLQDAC